MKKNIFKRDGPLIKVIAVVFAFSTLLSLFVVFPSAEVDDRAVPPEQNMVALPKGSYLFDDYLDVPEYLDTTLSVGVPFSFTTFVDESGKVFNGDGLSFVFDNFSGFSLSYNLGNGSGTSTPTSHLVYTDSNGWVDNRFYHQPLLKPCFQEIFITSDTRVPKWFYNWILDNSTYNSNGELVKISAGIYRAPSVVSDWNYSYDEYNSIQYTSYLPFTTFSESTGNYHTFDSMWIGYSSTPDGFKLKFIGYSDSTSSSYSQWYYQGMSEDTKNKWIIDSYRVITINHDFYVSREFYEVFFSIYHNITEYQVGYDEGYEQGYIDGNQNSDAYLDGYEAGFHDGETGYSGVVAPLFSGVINALDSWNFFGTFSLWDFIVSALTLMGMVWLLKLVAGG